MATMTRLFLVCAAAVTMLAAATGRRRRGSGRGHGGDQGDDGQDTRGRQRTRSSGSRAWRPRSAPAYAG